MGMLDKLRKKKHERMEQAIAELKVAEAQLVGDCEEVLRILKSSNHPSSMDFEELKYHFYRSKGLSSCGEQRILDGLKFLAGITAIGWAGHKGDSICFSKTTMPTQLVGMVK